MIRCNTEEEFKTLIIHIFFSDKRAKQDPDEVVCLEYEFIQSVLGIAQEEHDIADKALEDIEVDLLSEFMNGNHKYKDQVYPVYVEWDIRKWGCESCASIYDFEIYTPYELSLDSLMARQNKANMELLEHRAISAKLKMFSQ